MKLLAIDTSGPVCGVAVLCDGVIRAEHSVCNKNTHSVNLMPMVDGALTAAGVKLAELDRIAVVTGPGSFTGVRIGVSTVKALCHGAQVPCVAVDALEAMAAGISGFDGIVCPIQDARAGQVYGAAFSVENGVPERLMENQPIRLEDYLAALQSIGDRFLFLGDGMPVHRSRIQKILGDSAVFAPPQQAFLRPASAAFLGAIQEETLTWQQLEPMYLRAPNAERNKKLTEAAAHA